MEDSSFLSKLEELKSWGLKHGAVLENINFPVYYEDLKTVGISANKNIAPYEALLYIPSKIIIDSLKIERHDLKDFYERNQVLIDDSYEVSLTSLTMFIIFEILKEKESFWFPFLRLVSSTDLPIVWSSTELYDLQDEYFMDEIIDERIEINIFYELFINCMKKEVELGYFPKESFDKITIELFINVHSFCQTRNFYATDLQSFIVPIADFFNHSETDADFQIFNAGNMITKHMLEPSTDKFYNMKRVNHTSFVKANCSDLNTSFLEEVLKKEEGLFIIQSLEKMKLSKEDDITFMNDEDSFDENCNNDVINKMAKNIVKKKKLKKKVEEKDYYEDENDENVVIFEDQLILKEDDYFFISSGGKQVYKKDEQIFINYGQYSNEYLIFCYGFCYEKNHHNKTKIRLKFPKLEEDEKFFRYLKYILPKNFSDESSHYILKFNLIEKAINMDLLKYATFSYFYEINSLDVLFTYRFEKDIEIVIVKKILSLLETYRNKKFEISSLEEDKILLDKIKNSANFNVRKLFALIYRVANKEILNRQINLLNLLLQILNDGFEIGMEKFYESLEEKESFNLNRLILKEYFKFRTIKL